MTEFIITSDQLERLIEGIEHDTGREINRVVAHDTELPEVVRCRDCKYMFDWAYGRMLCKMWADADIDEPEGNVLYPCVKPDGFCAWGERRADA